jgi:hypothetical protein
MYSGHCGSNDYHSSATPSHDNDIPTNRNARTGVRICHDLWAGKYDNNRRTTSLNFEFSVRNSLSTDRRLFLRAQTLTGSRKYLMQT